MVLNLICYNLSMKKNAKLKTLTIAAIILFIGGPVLALLFTVPLGKQFCTPQNLEGTNLCIANPIPYALTLTFIPIFVGIILLIVAVTSNGKKR